MISSKQRKPLQAFISYSHKDERFRRALVSHLAQQEREKVITAWHDHIITAGEEIDPVIEKNMRNSQLIIFLVSADFLSSRYCMDIEVKRAMRRHKAGTARVIPIIVRDCDWHGAFGKLKALPTDGKPVINWRPQDKAWTIVVSEIKIAIRQLHSSAASQGQLPVKERSTPPPTVPIQVTPAKSPRTRTRKPAAVPGAAVSIDSASLIQRARSLVVNERNNYYGNGNLQVIVVGGPSTAVLRPAQIEDEALALDLEQKALYGKTPILVRGEKVTHKVVSGILRIEQQEASLSLAEDGALAIVQPARREADAGRLGISALIEEEVLASIERALRFSSVAFNRVDRNKRLTTLAVVVALTGAGYTPWRTRAEHAASPNSGTFGRGVGDVIVELGRPIPRDALITEIPGAAKDLMTLVRRQAKG